LIRNRTSIGVLGVLAAAALFSTSGTSKALLAPDAWPPSVAAVRLLVGAAGMVAFVLHRGWRAEYVGLLRHRVVWLMAVGVAGYQAFFFLGVERHRGGRRHIGRAGLGAAARGASRVDRGRRRSRAGSGSGRRRWQCAVCC
jgi:hypothetical protein